MHAGGESRRRQRSRQQIAVMYRQPDQVSVAGIEIGMRREKCVRLGGWRLGETVDIMVTIALGMGEPDQRAKRQVLLYAEASLAGQVLARDEVRSGFAAPDRRT